jgi:hypothetical protein
MQNQTKRLVKRRHARKRNNNARPKVNMNNLVIFTDKGRFSANRVIMDMVWTDQTTNRGNISANAMNFNIRSSAYDPDPSLGTGAIPGFLEQANLYESYCVHKMEVSCTFGNHELFPIVVGILPSKTFFNTNSLARSDCLEYLSNFRGKQRMLGSVNARSVTTIHCLAKGRDLLSHRLFTDLDFTSSVGTNPLALFYFNYFAYVHSTSNFVANVDFTNIVTYTVEFFDRRVLES